MRRGFEYGGRRVSDLIAKPGVNLKVEEKQ
jgi:hypothetical protein